MREKRIILALCAFFVLAVGVAGCGGSGDSVATVAGNPVSTKSFNHWLYVAAKGSASQSQGGPVIVPNDPPSFKNCVVQVRKQIPSLAKTPDKTIKSDCSMLFTSLSSQVMDFLVRAYWYQAEAAKRNIKVTGAQVQTAFESDRKQQFPTATAFNQFLAQSGQTMQDILFRVRINQLLKKLLAQHSPTVTPATIATYYRGHTSQFGTPESRNLRIVRTTSAKAAAAAKAALKKGRSWKAVTRRYSVDATTKAKGGLLTGVTRGQEEQALDKAAFSAPQKKVLGPVHGTFGYYVFEVIKIKRSTQKSVTQATPLIRQILQSQGQQNAQTALDSQVKRDWMGKTQCGSAYKMADCSGYKAPKTPSTSLSPGSAPSQGQQQAPSQGQQQAPSQGQQQAPQQAPSQGQQQAPQQAPSQGQQQAPQQAPSQGQQQAPQQAPSQGQQQAPSQGQQPQTVTPPTQAPSNSGKK